MSTNNAAAAAASSSSSSSSFAVDFPLFVEAERQRQTTYLAARCTGEVRGDYMASLIEAAARGTTLPWMSSKEQAICRGWHSFLRQTNPRPSADQIVFLRTLCDAVRSYRAVPAERLCTGFIAQPAFRAHWAGGDCPPPPEDGHDVSRFLDWVRTVMRLFPEAPASMAIHAPQPPPRVIAASARNAAVAIAADNAAAAAAATSALPVDDDEQGDEDDENEAFAAAFAADMRSSRDVIDLSSHGEEGEEEDVQILSSNLPPPLMTNFSVPAPNLPRRPSP